MTAPPRVSRIILLTTGVSGADGLSELSRQYVAALGTLARERHAGFEVWSLADGRAPDSLRLPDLHFYGAGGSRARFVGHGLLAAPGVDRSTLVVVLHAHLLPVAVVLQARGARVAVVLVGVEVWTPLRGLSRWAMRRAWRRLAISAATRDRFRRANPALATLDIAVCPPAIPAAAGAGDPGGVTWPSVFALIVGRMVAAERYKGHEALLAVWPAVRRAVPEAALLVVGGGDDAGRLRAAAGEGVTFTGPLPAATLAEAYRRAAFFAMPSTGEGFGFVFLEAMRAGKACLAAPGAAEEIVEDGRSGVIVDPADRASLEHALVRLFRDRDWRDGLGLAGREALAGRFRPEHLVNRLRARLGLTA